MFKFSTFLKICPGLRQLLLVLMLISSADISHELIMSEGRKPANYVPNDDVIVVPIETEMTFYEKHILNDEAWADRSAVQQQIKIWQENELMAQQYGLDTQSIGSLYYVPANEEKFKVIERSYFRYLKKKGEDPFKQEGEDFVRSWTADDEINSIDEMEAVFKRTTEKTAAGTDLPKSLRQKQIAKTKKFRFDFQPRVEQGLIILRMTGPILDARAWVGANGESEINVERRFDETGTRFMVNYFTLQGRYLSAIDQSLLVPGLRARFTSTWDPDQLAPEFANERRIQLFYGTQF